MVSRLALPFLHELGLEELVAASQQEYEERATRLATNRPELEAVKRKVREAGARAGTFDAAAKVHGVERALAAIVERHRAGRAPQTMVLD